MQQKNKQGRKAYCWEITEILRDTDEPNSRILEEKGGVALHFTLSLSLSCGTQAGETTLGGFGLERWRVRRRIKEGEKLGGDFSKAGAADRESNVEHMQAAASSNERGKTGEDSGAWQQREKRKRKGN